jgi:dCMP deaminase
MVISTGEKRVSKVDTYLNCAEVFAYRSTCIKRKYGTVIVKDDVVISTGYNGSPRGMENCCDIGECPRIKLDMHQGEGMEFVRQFMRRLMLYSIVPENRQEVRIYICLE